MVDELRENSFTNDHDIRVDVKQPGAVLGGDVAWMLGSERRATGDDACDPPGVVGVSVQLQNVSGCGRDMVQLGSGVVPFSMAGLLTCAWEARARATPFRSCSRSPRAVDVAYEDSRPIRAGAAGGGTAVSKTPVTDLRSPRSADRGQLDPHLPAAATVERRIRS